MRRSSSSVSWKRRERVDRQETDCCFNSAKLLYQNLSSSISRADFSPARRVFCAALLLATCYGFTGANSTSIKQASSQISAVANSLPANETQQRATHYTNLSQAQGKGNEEEEGEPLVRRFRRAAQSHLERGRAGSSSDLYEASNATGQTASEVNAPASKPNSIKNVTAQNGQSVMLHCPVEPSADGTSVSWFRGTGELQLLSFESSTIIQDERFVVRHISIAGNEHDWALQIKSLDKTTDSGLYQCQTNSEPPQSQYYQLNVVEPQVHILGAPDMAVKVGSSINLTCVISQSPDQLQFVFWYRDQRMINYDINERGKIVMSKLANKQDTIISNLQIFMAKLSDSGNYTCMPSGARPMHIQVHVLEGLDKRLIMFQNDYDPTSAASAQQSNSALSVHVLRLSRGHLYALFMAFVIFSAWFHLVAQTQTAISLLLLAVIGFLLGKATDTPQEAGEQLARRKLAAAGHLQLDYATSGKRRRRRRSPSARRPAARVQDLAPSLAAESAPSSSPQSADSSTTSANSTCTTDPLIKLANNALSILKSLSDDEDADEEDGNKSISDTNAPNKPRGEQQQQQNQNQALASPSAQSSSSSTGSTGYNSDTRSTNLTRSTSPTPLRVLSSPLNDRPIEELDELEGQMIELVSQPSALRLVMDEFSARSTPTRPDQVDRCAKNAKQSTCPHLSEEEGHYSAPALSLVQRPAQIADKGATCEPP